MGTLTKGELVTRAFKKLRISGITKIPDGGEIDDAITDLESYCRELDGTGYVTGYNYENTIDAGAETGLDNSLHKAFVKVLAVELMPDYGKGKDPDPLLLKQAAGALSVIHRITKQRRISNLPETFPVGKSARTRWSNVSRKYYPPREDAPFIPKPHIMYEGDISPRREDAGQWLQPLDFVESYTIDSTTGLQINSDVLDGNVIKYVIEATGETNGINNQAMRVEIVVTTDLGEVRTIKRYFRLQVK